MSFGHRWWKKSENYAIIKWMNENAINEWNIKIWCLKQLIKLYKKEKLIETKLFILIEINNFAPQPTSFPNQHTVVGETPQGVIWY